MAICDCGKVFSGEFRGIHFKFRDHIVKMYESGLKCDECSIDMFERNFRNYAEGYIAIANEEIKINWERILSLNKDGVRCNTILWLLYDLGIFSSSYYRNWSVDFGYENTNPAIRNAGIKLYFVRKKDASDYARCAFTDRSGFEIYRT